MTKAPLGAGLAAALLLGVSATAYAQSYGDQGDSGYQNPPQSYNQAPDYGQNREDVQQSQAQQQQ